MIEFSGWVTIKESYREQDDNDIELEKISMKLKNDVHQINEKYGNEICYFKTINGLYKIITCGYSNHKNKEFFDIFNLFESISKEAKGSYGIFSFIDDEDREGFDNEMQVFSLKKGVFLREKDNYLSPCVPTIEEI